LKKADLSQNKIASTCATGKDEVLSLWLRVAAVAASSHVLGGSAAGNLEKAADSIIEAALQHPWSVFNGTVENCSVQFWSNE
jgi:hypothetical protein